MTISQKFDYYYQLLKNTHKVTASALPSIAAQLVLADVIQEAITDGIPIKTNYPLGLEVGFIGNGSGRFEGSLGVSLSVDEPVDVRLEQNG